MRCSKFDPAWPRRLLIALRVFWLVSFNSCRLLVILVVALPEFLANPIGSILLGLARLAEREWSVGWHQIKNSGPAPLPIPICLCLIDLLLGRKFGDFSGHAPSSLNGMLWR